MAYSEEDFQIEIDGIIYEIGAANSNVQDFSRRHFNSVRENAVVYCLSRATDIAQGCLSLSKSNLLAALGMLDRGLLECLMWICWVVKADANAQTYRDLAVNELRRITRKNLRTGYGKVFDKVTQEDMTQEFLKSPEMQNIPRRVRIEDVAVEAGLERLYTQFYGAMSLEAHGSAFGISGSNDTEESRFVSLASANSILECINLVAENWIVKRTQTEISEIYRVLGLSRG
ncbi:hypothetical protein TFLX_05852 [Thermoflexales bacterium]|nr:hypothetical protein TFLX_05852 [Thermoflexales bacterium]